MEALASFLVPILLIVLFFFISFLRREAGGPISTPRRESPRPRADLTLPGAPAVIRARRDQQHERAAEASITWNSARDEERLERSTRSEAPADEPPRRRRERGVADRLPPVKAGRTRGYRPRPALLATRRAVREAFLTMELLQPPAALRDTGEQDRIGY